MEDVLTILNVVGRSFELIEQYLPSVVDQIARLIIYSNEILNTADLAQAHSEGVVTKLIETTKLAVQFMSKIDEVYEYISGSLFKDEADTLKDRGANHALIELKASLAVINEQLNECSRLYMEYEEKSLETIRECALAGANCTKKAREARSAKTLTRGIGGATTGVVAVGISASIVAGAFTFGVGTVSGLVATAAATGVVGIGGVVIGSVATHTVASSFKKAEDAYTALSTEFVCLRESCSSLNRELLEVHANILHVHSQVDQLERLVYNHPNRLHAYTAFKHLQQTSQRYHNYSSRVRAELKKQERLLELRG